MTRAPQTWVAILIRRRSHAPQNYKRRASEAANLKESCHTKILKFSHLTSIKTSNKPKTCRLTRGELIPTPLLKKITRFRASSTAARTRAAMPYYTRSHGECTLNLTTSMAGGSLAVTRKWTRFMRALHATQSATRGETVNLTAGRPTTLVKCVRNNDLKFGRPRPSRR